MPRSARRRTFARATASVHFWLSLVVGLQVFVWTASGLFMSVVPIERVRSEHRLAEPAPASLATIAAPMSAAAILQASEIPLAKLSLETVGGKSAYVAETTAGARFLLDAQTGARLSPIDADFARRIAGEAIREARPAKVDWIAAEPPIEYRGDLPVWRVTYDDAEKLAVYVAPDTGRIVARRSDLWRVYDFLWGLHIMDYKTREDFNHAPLIMFAAASFLMSMAGLFLLVLRAPRRFRRRPRAPVIRAIEPDDRQDEAA